MQEKGGVMTELDKPLLNLIPGQEGLLNDVQDLMLVGGMAIKRIDFESRKKLEPDLEAHGAMRYYSILELVSILAKLVESVDIQSAQLGISSETWMNHGGFLLKRAQDYCMLGRAEIVRLQNRA